MSFSRQWEQRYIENTHLSIWPWSDLVSFVRRHCPLQPGARVLELGCGAGANIPFFLSLGYEYHAIEGSPTITARLRERFPQCAERIVSGDFTVELPFGTGFDLVVDRGSVTHNDTAGIRSALGLACAVMKPGAYFVGIDWFSTSFREYLRGVPGADPYTRTGYQEGPFANVGNVHFSDAAHLKDLFRDFELIVLEEKRVTTVVPRESGEFGSWNLVARKPYGG